MITRWLSHRSLAERLRSTFYLAAAGIGQPAEPVIPAESVANWVRWASVGVWSGTGRPAVTIGEHMAERRRRFLVDCWVQGQITYHERTKTERTWIPGRAGVI